MENQVSKQNHEQRARLLEQAREMTSAPGVYLMKSESKEILYVGKAKNLRNRLLSYFQSHEHELPRIEMMVSRVAEMETILTETEAEALILEATLIKKYKPKFNVRLKDDKAYPYLKIQVNDPFPKIEWTRRVLRDGARYFGPFPSAGSARQVMELLNRTFQLRDCSENAFRYRSRPCILHQIGKCTAPCVGIISASNYRESIQNVIEVLEGKADSLILSLKKAMDQAAIDEQFELAAQIRDQIQNIELITQTQSVIEAGSQKNRDVIGLARKGTDAHGTLIQVRSGKMVSVLHFYLQNTDPSLKDSEVFFDFLSQYYLSQQKVAQAREQYPDETSYRELSPDEVLVPAVPEDLDLLETTLGIQLRVAETSVDSQLLNVARLNAEYALEQKQKKGVGHGAQALEEIQNKLHLQKFPHRIECYDISNTQGQDSVASRVVFIDGAPDKHLYRRYRIKTVEGANDFAMMKEVLKRRFIKVEEELPDLVVVDGGKGQLSQALMILDELSVQGIGVVGLAKARVEKDFRASEVKSSYERIFIPNRKNPVPLLPHTEAYKLLTHIRDEAHRFAIQYHRLLRSKRSLNKMSGS